jgi:hypothetical protein
MRVKRLGKRKIGRGNNYSYKSRKNKRKRASKSGLELAESDVMIATFLFNKVSYSCSVAVRYVSKELNILLG